MSGPEFLTPEEQKQLDKIVDLDIDTAIEERHQHETMKCMVCEAGELDEDGYCTSCNAKTDF